MAKPNAFIDVFVRNVTSTREASMAIDDHDLTVVAVIHADIEQWSKWLKDACFNTKLLKFFLIAERESA